MKLELPTRRRVVLRARGGGALSPRPPELPRARTLFSGALDLFASGDVALLDAKTNLPLDVKTLALADFHALRAIATHEGWLTEETLSLTCTNCDAAIEHAPCAAFALGPFLENALDDEVLDATFAFGAAHPVEPIRVGKREARTVVLAPRTVAEVSPLYRALARDGRVPCTPAIVRALGIVTLGEEADAHVIARALRDADESAFTSVTNVFVQSHYPERLFSIARCPSCGARNDVDAPADRELFLEPNAALTRDASKEVPDFEAFAEASRALAASLLPEAEGIVFLVEGGVAACDDGGDALLGSYVPPSPGASDGTAPTRPAEISVFYCTFRAACREDTTFDWRGELEDTIAHELAHHVAYLRGDDPTDDEERAAIASEARKIYGTRAPMRAEVRALGSDLAGFLHRTWPIWLLIVIATIVMTLAEK